MNYVDPVSIHTYTHIHIYMNAYILIYERKSYSILLFFFIYFHHGIFLLQSAIALQVITNLCSGVTTIELDNLAAETAATMINRHPDYAILAARIAISNLHKETKKAFSGEISQVLITLFVNM